MSAVPLQSLRVIAVSNGSPTIFDVNIEISFYEEKQHYSGRPKERLPISRLNALSYIAREQIILLVGEHLQLQINALRVPKMLHSPDCKGSIEDVERMRQKLKQFPYLLNAPQKLNNDEYFPALFHAVIKCHKLCVEFLTDNGADSNFGDCQILSIYFAYRNLYGEKPSNNSLDILDRVLQQKEALYNIKMYKSFGGAMFETVDNRNVVEYLKSFQSKCPQNDFIDEALPELKYLVHRPLSLQALSRISIRKCMAHKKYLDNIELLTLPRELLEVKYYTRGVANSSGGYQGRSGYEFQSWQSSYFTLRFIEQLLKWYNIGLLSNQIFTGEVLFKISLTIFGHFPPLAQTGSYYTVH
ncbi:hypothetical protein B566_EDAN010473, partial [Ephemera danica]